MSETQKKQVQTFERKLRLLSAEDYQFVFASAQRFGNHSFTILVRENSLNYARLGLAISKKNSKKAVDRNRIKRKFRESFRMNKNKLPNVDIIAMSRQSANLLDNKEMQTQIELQWHFIQKKFTKLNN